MKNIKMEIEKFYQFLKENQLVLTNLRSKIARNKCNLSQKTVNDQIVSTANKFGFNFTCEDLKSYEKELQNKYKLSDDQLLKVAGGVSTKGVVAGSLVSLVAAAFGVGLIVANGSSTPSGSVVSSQSATYENQISLNSYLKETIISEAQQKAFKITSELSSKTSSNVADNPEISSYRYSGGSSKTKLEEQLDLAVANGDLPIKSFTLAQINSEAEQLSKAAASNLEPQFQMVGRVDALKLSETADDASIVQVASQFNALESASSRPTEVKSWIQDHTQGPRASLQAVAAAKHREAAHLQGKLPDAIQEVLENCTLKDGTKILRKYPNLYKNGYLQLLEIKSVEDLETFRDFIQCNIGGFKFLSQWVKCEETGKKQLQVFSAAPSFQGSHVNWNKEDAKTNLLKEICKIIVVNEYKSIAQVAAIKSKQTINPVSLHLTLVGQGAFNNPPEIVKEALMMVKRELRNTGVKVYLHGWSLSDCKKWSEAMN